VTLNWAAGAVGVDVGVMPGVGVGELLLLPPHAVIANTIIQENNAALIECLDLKIFFNIVPSRRCLHYFPEKEENSKIVSQG
jgi:hypothetical protein